MPKEATARLKINALLTKAGWRLLDDENGKANVQCEANTKITQSDIDAWGDDYEKTKRGYIDFLLLDSKQKPLAVLEAKSASKDPLDGKEQARTYAQSTGARCIILSNGDTHYFWDYGGGGNPETITRFPTPQSLTRPQPRTAAQAPNPQCLDAEPVDETYIATTQLPDFAADPAYQDATTRAQYIAEKQLRILRQYQLDSIHALQQSAAAGNTRFLFEMATGTGKTLISAAVIKLFLRTHNATRVLFLVDRLELENQAEKNFRQYLGGDYQTAIYKHARDSWQRAKIVVSTVQTLTAGGRYQHVFDRSDFGLIIADESHRAIGGSARAVFDYFGGYKLGLTATPKDYLRKVNIEQLRENDPRKLEARELRDTYKTFHCESGMPTFRYSLKDGIKDKCLISPYVIGIRTEVTTKLLSEQGYAVAAEPGGDPTSDQVFKKPDFEKTFFSPATNAAFCRTFLDAAERDPFSDEIGKSIIFCVSQKHARKITQILNEMASELFPDKYQSDFAVQITSNIDGSQQYAQNFANNNLHGHTRFLDGYKTSRTRICVTVGMMTTGYDCPDILNIGLFRPIFSPTDFVQIRGRGTRHHTFAYTGADGVKQQRDKQQYKLFDFFANCDYFEHEFKYDAVLALPTADTSTTKNKNEDEGKGDPHAPPPIRPGDHTYKGPDAVTQTSGATVSEMRVDRELFGSLHQQVTDDADIQAAVNSGQWDTAEALVRQRYENKPEDYITLAKLENRLNLDRRLTWREVIKRIYGFLAGGFKTKNELLEAECDGFITAHKPDGGAIPRVKKFIKAYAADSYFRNIIDNKDFAELGTYPGFGIEDLEELGMGWCGKITAHIHANNATSHYDD